MGSFADYATATQAREVMERLVKNTIEKERPRIAYATVTTIDRPGRKCQVTYPGDTDPVTVTMGVVQPASVGQVVRIDGPPGDRFISDVMGNAYLASGGSTGNLTITGKLLTQGVYPNNPRFQEGIEIGFPAYIDFHRGAVEEATDYNMRIYNDAAGTLHVLGGQVSCDGILRAGAGSGAGFAFQTWGGGWYMQDDTWIRAHNNKAVYTTGEIRSGTKLTAEGGVRDDLLQLYSTAVTDYMIGVRGGTLFLTCYEWLSMDSRNGGANRTFDLHQYDGFYLRNSAWFRAQGSGGFYNSDALWGYKSDGNGSFRCISENTEQRTVNHKTSQGGYTSAAWESRSTGGVPHYSWHNAGERATTIRKDNGSWNMVFVDQNTNCCSAFAAGWGSCSDEARKTDISVMAGVGLKTIRGLEPKLYRYHPVTEDQIWATMKDREERAAGKWPFRVGQQESWEQWHVGYMAEEIYNRFPLAAYLDPIDNRPWAIDYGKLTIAAISAINELADRVEDLEALLDREVRHAA